MRRKLSAVIITKDEEHNIERCLRSLDWVDEIVVVDSGSADRTVEICERYGCRVVETEWPGFGKAKRLAVSSASNDWVMSVDADEEVPPELAREIEGVLSRDEIHDGYKVRHRPLYLGKWIKHSGWTGKYKLRLFDRRKGNYTEDLVHETVKLDGRVGRLEGSLNHYGYPDMATVLRKGHAFAEVGARVLREKGKRPSLLSAYTHSTWKFLKMYVFGKGFLDGKMGLTLAMNEAYVVYLKYRMHREMNREKEE